MCNCNSSDFSIPESNSTGISKPYPSVQSTGEGIREASKYERASESVFDALGMLRQVADELSKKASPFCSPATSEAEYAEGTVSSPDSVVTANLNGIASQIRTVVSDLTDLRDRIDN